MSHVVSSMGVAAQHIPTIRKNILRKNFRGGLLSLEIGWDIQGLLCVDIVEPPSVQSWKTQLAWFGKRRELQKIDFYNLQLLFCDLVITLD